MRYGTDRIFDNHGNSHLMYNGGCRGLLDTSLKSKMFPNQVELRVKAHGGQGIPDA